MCLFVGLCVCVCSCVRLLFCVLVCVSVLVCVCVVELMYDSLFSTVFDYGLGCFFVWLFVRVIACL